MRAPLVSQGNKMAKEAEALSTVLNLKYNKRSSITNRHKLRHEQHKVVSFYYLLISVFIKVFIKVI